MGCNSWAHVWTQAEGVEAYEHSLLRTLPPGYPIPPSPPPLSPPEVIAEIPWFTGVCHMCIQECGTGCIVTGCPVRSPPPPSPRLCDMLGDTRPRPPDFSDVRSRGAVSPQGGPQMCYTEAGQCVRNSLNICLILEDDCQPKPEVSIENCVEDCRRDKAAFFGATSPLQISI